MGLSPCGSALEETEALLTLSLACSRHLQRRYSDASQLAIHFRLWFRSHERSVVPLQTVSVRMVGQVFPRTVLFLHGSWKCLLPHVWAVYIRKSEPVSWGITVTTTRCHSIQWNRQHSWPEFSRWYIQDICFPFFFSNFTDSNSMKTTSSSNSISKVIPTKRGFVTQTHFRGRKRLLERNPKGNYGSTLYVSEHCDQDENWRKEMWLIFCFFIDVFSNCNAL